MPAPSIACQESSLEARCRQRCAFSDGVEPGDEDSQERVTSVTFEDGENSSRAGTRTSLSRQGTRQSGMDIAAQVMLRRAQTRKSDEAHGVAHGRHHAHHMRFFFEPPKLRKKTGIDELAEPHLHEDWIELFGDLILVAALVKLGEMLKYCGPAYGFPFTIMFFLTVYKMLSSMTYHINLFQSQDLSRLALFAVMLAGVFVFVMNINENSDDGHDPCHWSKTYQWGNAAGHTIAWGSLLIQQVFVVAQKDWFNLHRARRPYRIKIVGTIISIVLILVVTATVDDEWIVFATYFVSLIVHEVFTFHTTTKWGCRCARPKASFLPPSVHIGHYAGRSGLVAMICLGEAVLALLIASFPANDGSSWQVAFGRYLFMVVAFWIIFGLALLHFDNLPHSVEDHVLTKSAVRGFVNQYIYMALYYSLFLVGIAFKLKLYFRTAEQEHHSGERLFSRLSDDDKGCQNGHAAKGWRINGCGREGAELLLALSLSATQVLLLAHRMLQDGVEGLRKDPHDPSSGCSPVKIGRHVMRLVLALLQAVFGVLANDMYYDLLPVQEFVHLMLLLPALFLDLQVYDASSIVQAVPFGSWIRARGPERRQKVRSDQGHHQEREQSGGSECT